MTTTFTRDADGATGVRVSDYRHGRTCAVCSIQIKDNNKTGYCIHHCMIVRRNRRTVACDTCGEEFERVASNIAAWQHLYCSKKCAGIGQSKYRIGKKAPGYGKGTLTTDNKELRTDSRNKLNEAVRIGKVIKKPCLLCGNNTRPEAHHRDYSKPLDVVWLCRRHHEDTHHFPEKVVNVTLYTLAARNAVNEVGNV